MLHYCWKIQDSRLNLYFQEKGFCFRNLCTLSIKWLWKDKFQFFRLFSCMHNGFPYRIDLPDDHNSKLRFSKLLFKSYLRFFNSVDSFIKLKGWNEVQSYLDRQQVLIFIEIHWKFSHRRLFSCRTINWYNGTLRFIKISAFLSLLAVLHSPFYMEH